MSNEMAVINGVTGGVINFSEVDILVDDYRRGFGKTVEGILAMCKAVYESDSLGRKDEKKFYIEANLVKSSPTCKRFKAIGERYVLFQEKQDCLPSALSSIYELTKLSDEKFIEYVEDEKINPDKTCNEIKDLIGDRKPSENTRSKSSNKGSNNESSLDDNSDDLIFQVRVKGDDLIKIRDLVNTINSLADNDVLGVNGNEKFNNYVTRLSNDSKGA